MVDITRNNQIIAYSWLNISPADASTYFMGALIIPITVAGWNKIWFNYACKIIEADLNVMTITTLGSSENSTASVRLNDTSDTTISAAVKHDAVAGHFNSGALNIAIADGDFVEFKIVHPSWVTNPLGVYYSGQLLIERP